MAGEMEVPRFMGKFSNTQNTQSFAHHKKIVEKIFPVGSSMRGSHPTQAARSFPTVSRNARTAALGDDRAKVRVVGARDHGIGHVAEARGHAAGKLLSR